MTIQNRVNFVIVIGIVIDEPPHLRQWATTSLMMLGFEAVTTASAVGRACQYPGSSGGVGGGGGGYMVQPSPASLLLIDRAWDGLDNGADSTRTPLKLYDINAKILLRNQDIYSSNNTNGLCILNRFLLA